MSFTPKVYPGGAWVEYLPGKFASCGALDEHACEMMAYEMQANPDLAPTEEEVYSGALDVEITEGTLIWGRVIFVAGMSLMLLALIVKG